MTIRQSPQEGGIGPHWHDYVEIVIVRSGYGVQTIHAGDGRTQSSAFMKGDIFTVLPGEVHSYLSGHAFSVYNLCIGFDYLKKLSSDLPKMALYQDFFDKKRPFCITQFHLTPMEFATVEMLTHQLIRNLLLVRPTREIAISVSVLNLLLMLFDKQGVEVRHENVPLDGRLFAAIEQMEKHTELSFNVQEAAQLSFMSTSSFAHKFKNAVGISPTNYHILLRLDRAQQQLLFTTRTLKEIARANGFCDSTHFVLAFKKRYGVTPGQFRIQQQTTVTKNQIFRQTPQKN